MLNNAGCTKEQSAPTSIDAHPYCHFVQYPKPHEFPCILRLVLSELLVRRLFVQNLKRP